MSRSGYVEDDDGDPGALARWRGTVTMAIRGKRGQAFLRELADALDAMPEKRLIADVAELDGEFCALGTVAAARGNNIERLAGAMEGEQHDEIAKMFGISEALAREIMWENDQCVDDWDFVDVEICGPMRPNWPDWGTHIRSIRVHDNQAAERRWRKVREWVAQQMTATKP